MPAWFLSRFFEVFVEPWLLFIFNDFVPRGNAILWIKSVVLLRHEKKRVFGVPRIQHVRQPNILNKQVYYVYTNII